MPKHSKHHRQRYGSLTAKLDLTSPLIQSPSHAYNVQCLSKPASCAFFLACFPKNHSCQRRELPCSIHTTANQTSRTEHGTHDSKAPPKSPQKYGYVEHIVICSLVRALEQCPSVELIMTCVVQTISREFMGLIRQTPPTTPALS
jgi:hypothetical protein